MSPNNLFSITLTFTALACAGTPGAGPTDMSQASHEAAAQEHTDVATAHAGQADPNAVDTKRQCSGKGGTGPCWTSTVNPTTGHADDAEQHRRMAAEHRGASSALKAAETSACADLSEADRDTSPFDHREDILAVEELRRQPATGKEAQVATAIQGASITVRAVPGLTKEYLQRLVTCHAARNASMGFAMPEMAACPLSVKGATATVESAGGAFRVDIKGDSSQSSEAIARRAKELKAAK